MLYDVAIVGGGVAGLSAAYELRKRGRSAVVLEREARPGGIVQTERIGAFVIVPTLLLLAKASAVRWQRARPAIRLFPQSASTALCCAMAACIHCCASVIGFRSCDLRDQHVVFAAATADGSDC